LTPEDDIQQGSNPDERVRTDDPSLLAWPVLRLATLVRRAAAQRFRRMFDLSMLEWIIVVHLAGDAPLSLSALARHSGLDVQRTGAAVTRLTKRGLLDRAKNPRSGREVQVSLTARGRAVFNAIIENWLNKELCAGLSEAEATAARLMLDRLVLKAEQMLQREVKGEN
jgi:DNA-binding MarR family transcriptional regulator